MNSNSTMYGLRSSGGQHGDVFTSPAVVSFMLDRVHYTADRDLSQVSILEPSCGEGEFVVEIAQRLMLSAKVFGFDATEAFNRHVRAFDIDRAKIDVCRQRIISIGIVPTEQSIKTQDFLRVPLEKTDIVVGNPPYIRYENIPVDLLEYCRYTFQTFHYRCDLYIPFIEKTLASLRPGGLHCFICSNRWLKNEYGKKLRQLIVRKYQLREILNLERADAFQEEVLAYPAITVIAAEKPAEVFEYADCDEVGNLERIVTTSRTMPKSADWTSAFCSIAIAPSFKTIEQQGFKIGIGVATGADSVFISNELPHKVEAELIMPGINARDLRGNSFQWRGEYLLNPYRPDGTLVNLADYPRASAYLEKFRDRLSARHVAKKSPSRWYKTIDRISPSLLAQPKVLLPDISGNTFIFVDDGKFYPLHNIYYITGNSVVQLRLLAAFLMSDMVRSQLAAVTNQMNGGFSRWQSQHLRKLRLPDITKIPAEETQQLLSLYESRNMTMLNTKINQYFATA